jgi:GntR family transcriptional regulator
MTAEVDITGSLYTQVETALASDIAAATVPSGKSITLGRQPNRSVRCQSDYVTEGDRHLVARPRRDPVRQANVRHPTKDQTGPHQLMGFVEEMLARGRNPTARLLDKRIVPASKTVAQHLGVPLGARVYRIERLRLADGVAMSCDETYLPLEIGERVASNDQEAEPIFALLEGKCELPMIAAQYQLESVTAGGYIAQALGINIGSPVFLIERTSYTEGPKPINFEKLNYRGDLIKFVTRLSRRSRARPQP